MLAKYKRGWFRCSACPWWDYMILLLTFYDIFRNFDVLIFEWHFDHEKLLVEKTVILDLGESQPVCEIHQGCNSTIYLSFWLIICLWKTASRSWWISSLHPKSNLALVKGHWPVELFYSWWRQRFVWGPGQSCQRHFVASQFPK